MEIKGKLKMKFNTLLILILLLWSLSSCVQSSMTPTLQESPRISNFPTLYTDTPFNTLTSDPFIATATIATTPLPTQKATPTNVKKGVILNGQETIDARNVGDVVQIWELKQVHGVEDFSFLPDSSEIVLGELGENTNGQDSKAQISIWDLRSGIKIKVFDLDTPSFDALSINPIGRTVAVAAGKINQLDLNTGQIKNTYLNKEFASDPIQIRYNPSGDTIAIGYALIGTVVSITSYTGEEKYSVGGWFESYSSAGSGFVNTDIRCLVFSPDGKQLAVGEAPGGVAVLDAATGTTMSKISLFDKSGSLAPFSLEYSSDGRLLIIGDTAGRITIWDLIADKERIVLINPDIDPNYPFTPYTISTTDGNILFSYTSNSNTVFVWEIKSGKILDHFSVGENMIEKMELSPDGKVLAILEKNALYFYGVPSKK